jgi:hypothetical protein
MYEIQNKMTEFGLALFHPLVIHVRQKSCGYTCISEQKWHDHFSIHKFGHEIWNHFPLKKYNNYINLHL